MAETQATVRLNEQQWELVDTTIARGEAASREELFRMALGEFWREHFADENPKSQER